VSEDTEKADVKKTVWSYKDIKKRKKPAIIKVPIAMDGEFADEFNAAIQELREAQDFATENPRDKAGAAAVVAAEERVAELRPAVDDQVVEFVFRSVGRSKFENLVDSCPPTKAQKTEASKKNEEEPGWDHDTFPPTLIAAALVEPELSEEEAFDLWDSEEWNQAELVSLFLAALAVNQQRKVVDLGKEFGLTDS
jgi:chromatin segregation and condensation protein Rec8/ScpA/Scc1 (kleisin family)